MSVELVVTLPRTAMPSPSEWQQALDDAGFPVVLGADFDVDAFRGVVPCKYRGEKARFRFESAERQLIGEAYAGKRLVQDFLVMLICRSNLRLVSLISSAPSGSPWAA